MTGFFCQGIVVPGLGFSMIYFLLPGLCPSLRGILPFGFFTSLLLNLIVVDFLYYWQHRWFHQNPFLWGFHKIHHASPRVDIWTTSRNAIPVNFIFVYFLLNPLLGFCCQSPEGFLLGALITANLDLLRHSNIDLNKIIKKPVFSSILSVIVMPINHHQHHNGLDTDCNFAANLLIWDKMFGTFKAAQDYPKKYDIDVDLSLFRQLFPRITLKNNTSSAYE